MSTKQACDVVEKCIERLSPAHKEMGESHYFIELHESIGSLIDILELMLQVYRDGRPELGADLAEEAYLCAFTLRLDVDNSFFRLLKRDVDHVYRRIQLLCAED